MAMGWIFRKSFRQGPFRWTLSKRGVGWSVGIPGLRYGISPSGQPYISVGIPKTGLYWIKYIGKLAPGAPLPPTTHLLRQRSPGGNRTGLNRELEHLSLLNPPLSLDIGAPV